MSIFMSERCWNALGHHTPIHDNQMRVDGQLHPSFRTGGSTEGESRNIDRITRGREGHPQWVLRVTHFPVVKVLLYNGFDLFESQGHLSALPHIVIARRLC